jgi:hypothetical protein
MEAIQPWPRQECTHWPHRWNLGVLDHQAAIQSKEVKDEQTKS